MIAEPAKTEDVHKDIANFHNFYRQNPEIVAMDYCYALHEFAPVTRIQQEQSASDIRIPIGFSDIDEVQAQALAERHSNPQGEDLAAELRKANLRIAELEDALNEIYHQTSSTTGQMEIINRVLPQRAEEVRP